MTRPKNWRFRRRGRGWLGDLKMALTHWSVSCRLITMAQMLFPCPMIRNDVSLHELTHSCTWYVILIQSTTYSFYTTISYYKVPLSSATDRWYLRFSFRLTTPITVRLDLWPDLFVINRVTQDEQENRIDAFPFTLSQCAQKRAYGDLYIYTLIWCWYEIRLG